MKISDQQYRVLCLLLVVPVILFIASCATQVRELKKYSIEMVALHGCSLTVRLDGMYYHTGAIAVGAPYTLYVGLYSTSNESFEVSNLRLTNTNNVEILRVENVTLLGNSKIAVLPSLCYYESSALALKYQDYQLQFVVKLRDGKPQPVSVILRMVPTKIRINKLWDDAGSI